MKRLLIIALALLLFDPSRVAQAGPAQGGGDQAVGQGNTARLDVRPWRLSFGAGLWNSGAVKLSTITLGDETFSAKGGGVLGGLSLGYRVTPEWAASLTVETRLLEAGAYFGGWRDPGIGRAAVMTSLSLGARYYLPALASRSAVKPYLSAGVGPTLALEVETHSRSRWRGWRTAGGQARTMTALGGHLGAGVDFQIAGRIVLGADIAYHLTSNFSERVDGHRNGNGLTFAFQFGVNLGSRMRDRQVR